MLYFEIAQHLQNVQIAWINIKYIFNLLNNIFFLNITFTQSNFQ